MISTAQRHMIRIPAPAITASQRHAKNTSHLDGVYTNEEALVAELERKLGGRVAYQEITEIDLIHGHMLVDVRLRPGDGVIEPPPPKSRRHAADDATQALAASGPSGADNDGAALGV